MTSKEIANMYIKLRREGWEDKRIWELALFMETHSPTEDEAELALKSQENMK
mgnify:CR=1 FL=1